jgi:hypothetical protein
MATPISISPSSHTYTQNFDTLSNTQGSTANTFLPAGWLIAEAGGGARDNEHSAVDDGSSVVGDTYSYGAAAARRSTMSTISVGRRSSRP